MKKYLQAASSEHRNKVRAIVAHKELMPIIRDLAIEHWTPITGYQEKSRSFSLAWSPGLNRLDLSCYLSEIDSLKKDIQPLLEALMIDLDFEVIHGWECTDSKYKTWTLDHPTAKWKDTNGIMRPTGIQLYFYFGKSVNCRTVGTGEMVEQQEIVCGD